MTRPSEINFTQQIWLIRHGETAWSKTGQHTGWSDLPILPDAEAALKALRPHLARHRFSKIFSSPLQRARRTADLVGLSPVEPDDNLREWNYGDYDGKTKEEIRRLVPDWVIWTHGVKNGESIDDVAARARQVIDRTRRVEGDVALVSHGHLLRILASCWLGLPPTNAEHLALSTASISILGYENDLPVLAQWNWQPDQQ